MKTQNERGIFVSLLPKSDETNRVYVNSGGEGGIWICNEGSNILEIGDYVVSSSYQGYGMKEDDDILLNYTVAKLTEYVVIILNVLCTLSNGIKTMFVGCPNHCG